MRYDTAFTNVRLSFLESREDPDLCLKIVVRSILGERSEGLEGLLLWRHAETVIRNSAPRKASLLPNVEGQSRADERTTCPP